MKAARYYEPGRIEVEDIAAPRIGDGEIAVRVRAASICGTDLKIYRGGHPRIAAGQQRVLGHELAGDVAAVGRNVTRYVPGQRVSIVPNVGCGTCRECRAGLNNMCPTFDAFGITLDGGFQEILRVPAVAVTRGNVVPLPASVSYEAGALTEPLSCCYRGQVQVGVGAGDQVLIIGAGPIGIFHLILAKLAGARTVIVADVAPARLAIAQQLGADAVIDGSSTALEDAVRAETNGRGADVVITAVSSPAIQAEAVRLLAVHGRLNFFAGVPSGTTVPLDTNLIHYRSLTVTGTTGSSYEDYAASLRLVEDRRARLEPLVTATFPLDQIEGALEHAASGAGMKAVIVFDGSEA